MLICILCMAHPLSGCAAETLLNEDPQSDVNKMQPARNNWDYGGDAPDSAAVPGSISVKFSPESNVMLAQDQRTIRSSNDGLTKLINHILISNGNKSVTLVGDWFYFSFPNNSNVTNIVTLLRTIQEVEYAYRTPKITFD